MNRLPVRIAALACLMGVSAALAADDHKHDDHDHDHGPRSSIGTVKIGAYEIEVLQAGKVEAGKEATFELRVKGEPEPVAVRTWIGIESGRGSAKSKAHKHDKTLEAHSDVPKPIPEGAKLWIEIETPSGKEKASIDYKKD